MSLGKLLFSFEGRVGRATYWFYLIGILVFFGILGAVFGGFSHVDDGTANFNFQGGAVFTLLALLSIWPSLAIAAKRWHDVDKSAWWILIGLVPAIGGLIALVFNGFIAGTPGPNRFGPPPA